MTKLCRTDLPPMRWKYNHRYHADDKALVAVSKMERLLAHNEYNDVENLNIAYDTLGRLRRQYYPRIHPLERYTEKKFQARYRLTKNIAAAMADDFGLSEHSTAGLPGGGAISHRDRVRRIINNSFFKYISVKLLNRCHGFNMVEISMPHQSRPWQYDLLSSFKNK